ncbi:hypothetical protein GGQ88_000591 [Novosphingobium hassiacum]|uniref:Uncharacterized protein n=1 Tax=Novosphingobium hassiacum TaxID=173676 RepID=A0A7W6EUP6_9SPHN|nr:hypothetical protein [Novosphingobium hassiacum]MBB3859351.1 hypothetical protein [Novosphingobium hassiacum]
MNDARSSEIPDADESAQIRAAALAIRPNLEGHRSDKLLRLFDFLVERSLQGNPPTEAQIAQDVFSTGRVGTFPGDSNVRVYVHRLRRMLQSLPVDEQGSRLDLMVGSYMLRLAHQAEPSEPENGQEGASLPPVRNGFRGKTFIRAIGVATLAIVLSIAAWMFFRPAVGGQLADTMPWAAIRDSERPITIVMGDYYFFANQPHGQSAPSGSTLIWDRSVPAPEDLIIFQMLNPEKADSVSDQNQHYVTSATVAAAFAIRTALRRDAVFRQRDVHLVSASQLTPEILKSTDVVYIGQISGFSAILRDPVAQASSFRVDDSLVSMTDIPSGKQYRSDGIELRDLQISRRDYGYIARIPGPAQNSLILIASLRDAGLNEMVSLALDGERLALLDSGTAGSPQGFEAFYHVRTLGSANLGATQLLARPLRSAGIWDKSASVPEYRPIAMPTGRRR